MALKDISNGPGWIMWIVFAIFALMNIVLLTGHGAGLITGYNTASKEEKSKTVWETCAMVVSEK